MLNVNEGNSLEGRCEKHSVVVVLGWVVEVVWEQAGVHIHDNSQLVSLHILFLERWELASVLLDPVGAIVDKILIFELWAYEFCEIDANPYFAALESFYSEF